MNLETFCLINFGAFSSYFVPSLYWVPPDLLFFSLTLAIPIEAFLRFYKEVTSTIFLRYYSSALPITSFNLPCFFHSFVLRNFLSYSFSTFPIISFEDVSHADVTHILMLTIVHLCNIPEFQVKFRLSEISVTNSFMWVGKATVPVAETHNQQDRRKMAK